MLTTAALLTSRSGSEQEELDMCAGSRRRDPAPPPVRTTAIRDDHSIDGDSRRWQEQVVAELDSGVAIYTPKIRAELFACIHGRVDKPALFLLSPHRLCMTPGTRTGFGVDDCSMRHLAEHPKTMSRAFILAPRKGRSYVQSSGRPTPTTFCKPSLSPV